MKNGSAIWLIPTMIAALLCGSCASGSAATDVARVDSGVLAAGEIEEKPGTASYYLLVAGMAMQKELYDIAAENYRKAAYASDDATVAKKATEIAFELGRNDDALLSAKRWLKLDPESAEPHAYLARLYVRDNNAKRAARSLQALIEMSEAEPKEVFDPVVRTLGNEENTEVAMAAVERLVKKYKRLPQAHYAMGIQALRNGQFDVARASAKKAIKLDEEWPPAHLLLARVMIATGEVESGIEYAGEHVGGTNSAYERLEYGILLAAVDRDFEAGMILEQVLEDDPTNVAALRALGILDLKAGDLDLAERRFTALLSTGRVTFDALYYLASIAETREQDQRAYKLYSEVRSGDNAVISQLRAANILYRAGQLDEALQHLERFANQQPKHTMDMAMGQGDLLADGGRADEALMLYDNILQKSPDESRAQYARAFLLERLDRVADAIHQMRIILAANPTDPTALNALGYTLADRTDQHEEAAELIKLAYAQQPDSGPIIDSYGWVEFKLGNYDRARELLDEAFARLPDAEIAAHLIEVMHAQGDTEALEGLLAQADADFPEDENIQELRIRLGL